MKALQTLTIVTLILVLTGAPVFVQAQAGRSATAAPIAKLDIRIVAVQGLAQYRNDEGQPWQPAKPGVRLSIGAEFRTGPRSRVQFSVGDDHTITLDRLGVIKVIDAIQKRDKVYTEMGMKYGRSSYQVQLGGAEHDAKVRTPSATLAVRGSRGFVQEYAGRSPIGGSDYGDVEFKNTDGIKVRLDPETSVEGDQTTAAQRSREIGAFLATLWALTPEERTLALQQHLFGVPGAGEAAQGFSDQEISQLISENFTALAQTIFPNMLDATVMFVSKPTGQPVDVDISLRLPSGNIVDASTPIPLFVHSGDISHNGVLTDPVTEFITNFDNFVAGDYVLTVINQSASETARIEVFVDVAFDPEGFAPVDNLVGSGSTGLGSDLPPLQMQTFPFTVPDSTFNN